MKIKEIEQDKLYENTYITVNIKDMKGAPKDILKEATNHGSSWYDIGIKNRKQYQRIVDQLDDKSFTIHDKDKMYEVRGDFAERAV